MKLRIPNFIHGRGDVQSEPEILSRQLICDIESRFKNLRQTS
jgi:hypothetical protein